MHAISSHRPRPMVANLTVGRGGFTIRDSPQSIPAARHMRCFSLRRRHTECAYTIRLSHGCSQATIIEHAEPQAAFASRQKAQATGLLPQVQHRRAAACYLPQLRQLHGPGDGRERRGGVVRIEARSASEGNRLFDPRTVGASITLACAGGLLE